MTIQIRNWKKFQHFKDRRPPWIKLYRDLLDDIEFYKLSGEDTKILVQLWLLASENGNNGTLPDIETISFRLRTTDKVIKNTLSRLKNFVIYNDITAISARYRDGLPETETETETETDICPELENQAPDLPPVISIPLIKRDGDFNINQKMVDEWSELFPGVDVPQTLREIKAWNMANPERRKTARGIMKHVTGWLSKEQCKA